MASRSGSADLPLHGGRVPPWLATRMSALGAIVTQAIVQHYGRDDFLQRHRYAGLEISDQHDGSALADAADGEVHRGRGADDFEGNSRAIAAADFAEMGGKVLAVRGKRPGRAELFR